MNTTGHYTDPRVRRSCAAIIHATGELLTETGVSSITAESIAARAHVSKATLYRHWHTLARQSTRFRELHAEIHDLTIADLEHCIAVAARNNELSADIPIDEHLAHLVGPLLYLTLHPRPTDTSTP